ncbi:MAG TPA: SH3 domain-containing protein [Pyrinomonadaceae bacterium]|nr:SH3 domain-containing protein [Pyrinomonadaceae bacterium]
MKQCPACRTTYTDDSLSYCLSDGASLISVADEEQTVVRKSGGEPLKVDLGSQARPTEILHSGAGPASAPSIAPKVLIGSAVLLFLLITGIGLLGAIIYFGASSPGSAPLASSPSPSPSPPEALDAEKERLRDELANIRRKLDEKEKEQAKSDLILEEDDPDLDPLVTAKVNSPNDGFLALRSHPSVQTGERLARIPHRATVEILNCNDAVVFLEGRRGRWCEVDYEGQVGWVFDAWLEY